VHFDEDVTPYIHALVYHVPQFLEKCGSIANLSCQPVEKKNHELSAECSIVVHKRVDGTQSIQFRLWKKRIRSGMPESTTCSEPKGHTPEEVKKTVAAFHHTVITRKKDKGTGWCF